jgi:DNA repair exonuclease SbcCD nuclease subunit
MSRFTFVHAADLHLDTPFEALGPVPEHIALALRDASLDAWSALVDLTIDRDAVCLLLAGDVYDGEQRGLRAQARFRRGLEELSARGVQVFLVHGNHDPLDGWAGIPRWPAGVTLFPSDDVASVDLQRDGQHLATVYGISYARRDCAENLAQRFRRGAAPGLHIGLLHANVGGNTDHAPCSPCSVEDLRRAGMDYWALGHIHERAYLGTDAPWIVYPGVLQSRGMGASERGQKGAVVVEAEDDAIRRVSFVPLDRVRSVEIHIEASDVRDATTFEEELLRQSLRLRDTHGDCGLLVEVTVGGAGLLPADCRSPEFRRTLVERLRQRSAAVQPFVWWVAVHDETTSSFAGDDSFASDELIAAILRRRLALLEDAAARGVFLQKRFEDLERVWIADLEPSEVEGLFREATELAVDLLRRRGPA